MTALHQTTIVLALMTLGGLCAVAEAGEFDDIRGEVRQPSQPRPKPSKKRDHHDDDDDHHHHGHHYHDHDDDGGSILGNIIGSILFSAFTDNDRDINYHYDDGSPASEADYASPSSEMFFAHFPYEGGHEGYMMHEKRAPAPGQSGGIRFNFEFGSDFDDVNRYAGGFLAESSHGWGIDGQWNFYTEQIFRAPNDHLHVGDINVLYRLIETERMQIRLGLGMNWFDSSVVSDTGVNGTVVMDYYPDRPFIFSGQIDYGNVGDAEMFHGAFSLGAIWRNAEFFAGYDYRKIGPVKLEGPMFGVRLWW